MTRTYKTTHILSASFMSHTTFIHGFSHGWELWALISGKKLIHGVKTHPQFLHLMEHICVSIRHMTLDSPVTSSDRNNEIVTPAHKRLVYYFLT